MKKLKNKTGKLWIGKEGVYSPAASLDGNMIYSTTSSEGHLLYSSIPDRKHKNSIVRKLFGETMMTEYGIRTTASDDTYFDESEYQRGSVWFNDNWVIMQGLLRHGFTEEYKELRGRILDYIIKEKYPKEYIGISASGALMNEKKLKVKPCAVQAWTLGMFIDIVEDELRNA